ncbi:MAG: acylphosphatase [Candidatus Micrarchaeia archaeon]
MILAKIIAKGRVQGVFYRATVREIANKIGVGGYVRNLPNGDVEVVCECKDEEQLHEFVKAIDIKNNFGPYTEEIKVVKKQEKRGSTSTDFVIIY